MPNVRAIVVLLAIVLSQLGCAGGPRGAGSDTIAVGTFNIRYANKGDGANAWEHRQATVIEMLREGDFWGLQEALPAQVATMASALPAYGMVVRSREKNPAEGEACPILYRSERWTLDAEDHETFWLSETPEVPGSKSWDSSLPRVATMARFIETSSGRGLYVVNVHLDHRGAQARLESALLIARRLASRKHADPVIVLGDFNTGPASPPIRALLDDAGLRLVDAWRAANADERERGTFNGWAEACTGDRIDYILVTTSLNVDTCEIDDSKPNGRWPSDHAAVRAVMRWKR